MTTQSLIQDQIGKIIGLLFLSLSSYLAAFGETLLPVDKLSTIKAPIWAKTICILLLAIVLLLVYILLDKRLKLRYGIYWDRKKNPYCPSCKKPLQLKNYCAYRCVACDKAVFPSDGSRGYLPIEVLRRLLSGEEVNDEEITRIHNNHTPKGRTVLFAGIPQNREYSP